MTRTNIICYMIMVIALISCNPKVSKTITKSYAPLKYTEEVIVYDIQDQVPDHAENLGTVKIGDSGFTTQCDLPLVMDKAKTEARKAGGNIIKIIEHSPPSFWGSSCHRITVHIYKAELSEESIIAQKEEEAFFPERDYAVLHIYRFGGAGAMVGYDIHLGEDVICRAKNNWKTSVEIRKDGLNSLWAKTESKAEIPIKIESGREYYVRCGITFGALVGRPTITLVDHQTGKREFNSIDEKNRNK